MNKKRVKTRTSVQSGSSAKPGEPLYEGGPVCIFSMPFVVKEDTKLPVQFLSETGIVCAPYDRSTQEKIAAVMGLNSPEDFPAFLGGPQDERLVLVRWTRLDLSPVVRERLKPCFGFWDIEDGVSWMPSNGTETMFFEGLWCEHCTKQDGDGEKSGGCPIQNKAYLGDEEPAEWIYAASCPCCTAFEPERAGGSQ